MRVPAGVADGQRIRVKGRGGAGANGGPPGDLYVVVHVRPHALFGRNGNDLTLRVPVTFAEAALGADVKVPTLDGQVTVRIPPGTPSGKVHARPRQGHPERQREEARATCSSRSTCRCPTELNDEQRAAVEALAEVFDRRPARRVVRAVGDRPEARHADET